MDIPDHLLHIDGEFRGKNDYDFNFIAPNIDVSKLLFALLNDPDDLVGGLGRFLLHGRPDCRRHRYD